MKKTVLILAALLSSAAAQAKSIPLVCQTQENRVTAEVLTVRLTQGPSPASPVIADIRQTDTIAHTTRAIGLIAVQTTRVNPDVIVYFNRFKQFELSMTFSFGRIPSYRGNLVMELDGQRVNEPVSCFVSPR